MIMSRRQRLTMAVVTMAVFFSLLWVSLHHDPHRLDSPLLNHEVPDFQSVSVLDASKKITNAMFKGQISVLNVFASWCNTCAVEHVLWVDRHFPVGVALVALDYMNTPKQAASFLKEHGNPYAEVISDPKGSIGIDFGVYGVPETYLIDASGVIRFKQIGVVTDSKWDSDWLPRIKKLRSQHAST